MFKEKLKRVVTHVDGSIGCVLMGFDGIQIDSVFTQEEMPEMGAIAIEVSNLLGKFRRLKLHEIGQINEVSLTTGTITTLARVIAEDYLLILAVRQGADINRGQTMLRLISPSLEREM